MKENILKTGHSTSLRLQEKLTHKQADLNVRIKELESFIKDSPKSSHHTNQVTTTGDNARLSSTQIAEIRSRNFKNFITFVFALMLFGSITYLLYISL